MRELSTFHRLQPLQRRSSPESFRSDRLKIPGAGQITNRGEVGSPPAVRMFEAQARIVTAELADDPERLA